VNLVFENPIQPILAMPLDAVTRPRIQGLQNPSEVWRCYLHRLAWSALQPWLQEEFEPAADLWPAVDPGAVWQVVEGLALTLGPRRVVVMVTEAMDVATLQIPQEWVDIPGWGADYYLAAQVDLERQLLALWGYATYKQVKQQGEFDGRDRTYTLSEGDIIQDFSAFWVAQQLEAPQSIEVAAVPPLAPAQAEALLPQLVASPEPRLEVPFEQWAGLLQGANWRRQLYERRQNLTSVRQPQSGTTLSNLSRWLDKQFEPGWHPPDRLLPQMPALAVRSTTNSQQLTVRGKTCFVDSASGQMVLVIAVSPMANGRRSIRVQLYAPGTVPLPPGVMLCLDSANPAERLQAVQAREHDNYIQLPSFRCPAGQQFRISIQLGDEAIQEEFVS
jgi:hypothetical protein